MLSSVLSGVNPAHRSRSRPLSPMLIRRLLNAGNTFLSSTPESPYLWSSDCPQMPGLEDSSRTALSAP